ncbi:MAG: DUF4040 domain-containing protein [Planctomycetota bacterium]
MTGHIVTILILTLLACTAVTVAHMRNLFAAAMATGIYSFLGASWMLFLDAPDVAFTEAAVGAGISTVLMLSTLALTTTVSRDVRIRWGPLAIVVATGAVLIYGTLDMPHFGDPSAPIHNHPDPGFVEIEPKDFDHVPNVVTAVLGSYRGYDTLGETAVVFTAGIAVLLLLRRRRSSDESARTARSPGMRRVSIVRVVAAKTLIPFILLFALYVQFHGDYGPGGGFQAGVIFAAGFILYGLVFGQRLHRVAPPHRIEPLMAMGVLIYAGVGLLTMALGGNFLEYAALAPDHPQHGQHYGLLFIEFGVGVAVFSVMLTIFYSFDGRGDPVLDPRPDGTG